jgi:PAS domain S-box-containing protein
VSQSEAIPFALASILYLATMIFVVLMLREQGDRRPWLMLLGALGTLFVYRMVGFLVVRETRQELGPWVTLVVSAWLLASLFYFRAITVAGRETKLLAERRTTERDESESRYRALAELCPDVMYVNVDGRICYVNEAAVRFFGAKDASEMLGRSPISLAAPSSRDRVAARSTELKSIGQVAVVQQEEWQRLDGSVVPVEAAAAVVPWQGTTGILVMLRDVSERRHAEEVRTRLLASERTARSAAEHANSMKDEFLATLSHELRTPLTAIVGWSQILLRGRTSEAEMSHGLEAIDRNTRALTKLVEDLLDMSSILSGKFRLEMQLLTPLPIVQAAIETLKPTAEAKRIHVKARLDPQTGRVRGDANRLQQIVWNLLTNAVKFTPEDGTVSVTLDEVDGHVRICVADTGPGISADFLPFMFDRFRQADASIRRKHSGLGIGLAIVKQLAEMHGGEVFVQNTGHDGTTFVVTLPMAIKPERNGQDTQAEQPDGCRVSSSNGKVDLSVVKVLVVDDEPDTCRVIKWALSQYRADVVTATSAAEALPLIEASAPDILISDIGMPEVDGYELLKRIRSLPGGREIPAIALTAFARPEDEAKSLAAGYSVHISKPITPDALSAAVASLAERAAHAAGSSRSDSGDARS